MRRSSPPSLRARALQALAQREYSRAELRAKLLRRPVRGYTPTKGTPPDEGAPPEDPAADSSQAVDDLLTDLESHGLLSDQRFVESRVHVRSSRFGNLRIQQELQRHGVALDEGTAAELRRTELQRAQAVWARRFGQVPVDASERARQMRFLGARGFSPEVIHQVLKGLPEDDH